MELVNMDMNNACWKIFNTSGLYNVFQLLEESNNREVQSWIFKSKHELNRFAQYIISLKTLEKAKPDYYTCQAIHESLNGCSVCIVFSLFNIFALTTKTRASFFDQSIRDYFMERSELSIEESYLLSFFWHETVLSMNSLGYSPGQFLNICKSKDGIGFNVLAPKDNSVPDQKENVEITSSLKFYTFHLFQLLSTIDLVANLLNQGSANQSQNKTPRFLQIKNYHDLYTIYKDILKEN